MTKSQFEPGEGPRIVKLPPAPLFDSDLLARGSSATLLKGVGFESSDDWLLLDTVSTFRTMAKEVETAATLEWPKTAKSSVKTVGTCSGRRHAI